MNMPLIGFGTWVDIGHGQDSSIMKLATQTALQVGYRHFDTAFNYETEDFVVESIIQSGIPRDQIFITNKSGSAPTVEDKSSTIGMKINYYDLFLLHHPPLVPSLEFKKNLIDEWIRMNNLLTSGLVKAIGVSNFYDRQLRILLDICEELNLIKPSVNQIELHPFNQNWELVFYCQINNIQVVAHSPLGGLASQYILQSEIIKDIADEISATPAQVILASALKRGIGVIPRSLKKERMIENLDSANFVSSITDLHLELLRTLDANYPMIILASTSYSFNEEL
jgi:diketogulonate reductase-like aldo/keto reductase